MRGDEDKQLSAFPLTTVLKTTTKRREGMTAIEGKSV
jgi:hypothetical protein